MSIKVPKPIAVKPVYKGEKLDRTSGEMLLCRRCSRLATHRAIKHVTNGSKVAPLDMYFCDFHVNEAIKWDDVRGVREMDEFRRHLKRLRQWTAESEAGTQGALV